MKPTILLLLALILTACTAVTPPPAPTVTPPPTPTPTPTLTPTPTSTPIPTLPPQQVGGLTGVLDPRVTAPGLFDLAKSDAPIPQFVNAMRMGGIEVDPQNVVNNLQYQPITGVDGKQYVIGTFNLDPDPNKEGETLEGPIPLVIWSEERGWSRIGLKDLCNNCGTTVDFSDPDYRSENYNNTVLRDFTNITLTGAFMEKYWHYNGPDYWTRYANRNRLPFYVSNFFFNFDDSPSSGAENFFRERINKALNVIKRNNSTNPVPWTIVLGGEPYFYYNNQVIWHGQYDQFMPYQELGENWIIQAEIELLNQIVEKGFEREQFNIIGLNLPGLELPGPFTEYTIRKVIQIKQAVFNQLSDEVKTKLNITTWEEVPFDIGLEFHLGKTLGPRNVTVPLPLRIDLVIENYANITTRTKSRLHITELDGVGDQKQIAEAMAQLILNNNFVESITFFEPFKPPEGENDPWQNILYNSGQEPTQWYYYLLQLLYS